MNWLEGLIGKEKFKKLTAPERVVYTLLSFLGVGVISFGPVLFDNMLNSESEEEKTLEIKKIRLVLEKISDGMFKGAKATPYTDQNSSKPTVNKFMQEKKDYLITYDFQPNSTAHLLTSALVL
jgi:hypothetical protein